ncbi:polyprenol monophosphomannose synthase [Microbacteriaceae bacterium VKM Ac-2855]|nr:polyprenol monophosphomannose synthase [Microbacteriaceae bacterium VKM Ac-2855]
MSPLSRSGVSIVVPTFNEAPNIDELVRRISASVDPGSTEILFVDDSTDETPDVIRAASRDSVVPIRLEHRTSPDGGLSGAVIRGLEIADGAWCIVMDGDLQHPPELIPILLARGRLGGADVVVASRNVSGGSSEGLDNGMRHLVSAAATLLARSLFPRLLGAVTDPMTGYFAVRRAAIDVRRLQPRGFKILLEILVRNAPTVLEEPFVFARRYAGSSKADLRQGASFVAQLVALRLPHRDHEGRETEPTTVSHAS